MPVEGAELVPEMSRRIFPKFAAESLSAARQVHQDRRPVASNTYLEFYCTFA